jgi:hypothetical protein
MSYVRDTLLNHCLYTSCCEAYLVPFSAELEDTFLRRSENVQAMYHILNKSGSKDTVGITAHIRNKRNVQQELLGMKECMDKMKKLLAKEVKKWSRNRSKLSKEVRFVFCQVCL